jgi:predicted phosphodiesterase
MTKPNRDDTVSRRTAVAALGVGAVGGLQGLAESVAEEKALPDFSFLVVSDTHLGRMDSETPAKQWASTAKELDAAAGDFVLHLGDVVDGGREAQYAVYKDVRKTIRKPIHEIPGNHDPQELFEKHLRKPVELAFDHKGIRFLLLNNSRTDSHDGFLTAKLLAWLGEQLADAAKKELFSILAMHVPVHESKHPDRGWYVKPKDGQTDLYALLTKHRGLVLALLHGHFHNGIRGWDDHAPLQEVIFPSALYNQDRNLAKQNAQGFYLAEHRPGFVRVTLGREGMKLAYRPLGEKDTSDRVCPLDQLKGEK